MSRMISVASGFQYSVNIGYDLNRDDKLKNFIPTKSSVRLLKEILKSMNSNSTERARVLVGAYGKGKSHIVLTILAMLMQRPQELFVHLMPKINEDPELKQLVDNYYANSNNRILPVVISGTSTSLPQAFLQALQRTLMEYNLSIMPETNYEAAVKTINKWKEDYPNVYSEFEKQVSVPVDKFVAGLQDYNVVYYEEFEKIYPTLTAGSVFNPFVGFDIVDLYESVAKSLKELGYLGIYVIYDEFSKFLEANIAAASVSDTKMLQDFAEKCNRSGATQMHIMLISHKEISNYIDQLPKQKVDGWRGVSERFKHIHLNNNFSQTYEIISTVIIKEQKMWESFCEDSKNKKKFERLIKRYSGHSIFNDAGSDELDITIYGCYPLHPVSTFILPRLSERIAQNERTLFTFLSADGISTLSAFIKRPGKVSFRTITPDLIFDYFEPVFQKEPISGEIHKNYVLTMEILEKIRKQDLESRIVKVISLIYTLGQFEKLKPTKEEITGIFDLEYTPEEIDSAISHLIKDEYVIYLKQSNNYLKLKQTSGIDVEQKISDLVVASVSNFSIKESLNSSNIDSYLYPSRYNDEREMIRYFKFEFVEEQELEGKIDWIKKSENIHADGIVYAIVPTQEESLQKIKEKIITSSSGCKRCIFIVPKKVFDVKNILMKYEAVKKLKNDAKEDTVLFEEYEVIYEDLQEVINTFISGYTHPEEYKSLYFYDGEEKNILRKASLTELASKICDVEYSETPVINNEAINKDEITSVANSSRSKIIAGLLRKKLEPNLGLSGTGQEVSIMRSTLIRKEVLVNDEPVSRINLSPSDEKMKNVLDVIVSFVMDAKKNGRVSFARLYERLKLPEFHIGIRNGVIPLYIAAVFHEYSEDIVLQNDFGQLPINADTLQMINVSPEDYSLVYIDWNAEKQSFVTSLEELFAEFVVDEERDLSAYEYVVSAMQRWYLSLPRYSKETKGTDTNRVSGRYQKMVKLLKQKCNGNELLFEKLPDAFGYKEFNEGLSENIKEAKCYYDDAVSRLKQRLITETKHIFSISSNRANIERLSMSSVIKDWCETLDDQVFEQLFENGTDKCLGLFKNVTNDENSFISRLAKAATDLRIEDWNDNTETYFFDTLKLYKETAENFESGNENTGDVAACAYEIRFRGDDGSSEVKRFERVESSNKGKLLYNSILSEIDSMGYSISEQEKRQILMDILRQMC